MAAKDVRTDGAHPAERVTARQQQVVDGVRRGLANKQIAAELGISERAVKGHVSDLLRKFAVPNRAGLIAHIVGAEARRPLLQMDAADFERYANAPFMLAVTVGPEHRFVFVNDVSAAVAGCTPHDLVGRTMQEAYPDLDPRYAAALDEVYRTAIPWSTPRSPARFPRADGTVYDTLLNLMFAPMRDANGAVVGLLHVGSEVSPDDD